MVFWGGCNNWVVRQGRLGGSPGNLCSWHRHCPLSLEISFFLVAEHSLVFFFPYALLLSQLQFLPSGVQNCVFFSWSISSPPNIYLLPFRYYRSTGFFLAEIICHKCMGGQFWCLYWIANLRSSLNKGQCFKLEMLSAGILPQMLAPFISWAVKGEIWKSHASKNLSVTTQERSAPSHPLHIHKCPCAYSRVPQGCSRAW